MPKTPETFTAGDVEFHVGGAVYVLLYSHEHGCDVGCYANPELAFEAQVGLAKQYRADFRDSAPAHLKRMSSRQLARHWAEYTELEETFETQCIFVATDLVSGLVASKEGDLVLRRLICDRCDKPITRRQARAVVDMNGHVRDYDAGEAPFQTEDEELIHAACKEPI